MTSLPKPVPIKRQYECIKIEHSSNIISSFYLRPVEGPCPNYTPGDYLVFDIPNERGQESQKREYSISLGNEDWLRVSVKLEEAPNGQDVPPGIASSHFHNSLNKGDIITAYGPTGKFELNDTKRPVVMLGGGVGQTPLVAMAHELAKSGDRETVFIHACENGNVHAFEKEIKELTGKHSSMSSYVFYAAPLSTDSIGVNYDYQGFVTADVLDTLIPSGDVEYYLCGPKLFMEAMYQILSDKGVNDDLIRYEFFGPATLLKSPKVKPETPSENSSGPTVLFAKSDVKVSWGQPDVENLLELAEEHGVIADYSCRAGTCDTCKTKIISGKFSYDTPPMEIPEEGFALICCAKPDGDIILDL